MPTDIDGFVVLAAIAAQPQLFAAAKADANKAARALVVKQLKQKSLSVDALRQLVNAIGTDAFALITDAMSDADIKSLTAKLDKENGDVKAADARTQRQHVAALARGTAAPQEKARAVPKAGKASRTPPTPTASTPVERAGNSKAMRAKRKTVV